MPTEPPNGFIPYCQGRDAYEAEQPRESPHIHKSGLEYAHVAWLKGWDQGEYDSKHGLVHVAGQMSGGVQHCVICGEILTDLRGAAYAVEPGQPAPVDTGWAPGPVTVVKDGPQTHYTAGAAKRVPVCKPQ